MDAKLRMFGEAPSYTTGPATVSINADGNVLLNGGLLMPGGVGGNPKFRFFSILVVNGPAQLSAVNAKFEVAASAYTIVGAGAGFEDHGLKNATVDSGMVKFFFFT